MNKRLLTLIGSILVIGGVAQAKEVMASPVKKFETSVESRLASLEESRLKDGFEFHGYFRTGSDGNFSNSFRKVGDRNKNLIGRWGNEYDTFTGFNFSKKFYMDNGAWAKTFIELDNWNNDYQREAGINLATIAIQMGNIPTFKGAFKDSVISAGKQGWGNRAVDMTDYFYQDMDGVGLGIDGIKVGEGKLGFAYITSDANDGIDKYYRPSVDTGYEIFEPENKTEVVRAARATYEIKDFTLEMVYSHAGDNDEVGVYKEEDGDAYTRNSAKNGFYTGLYYNPQNFYGAKGWGQHFAQVGTGTLAGSGLGRLDTQGNFLAHRDSTAFQIGTNGGTNITEKLSIMTALRYQKVSKLDARENKITNIDMGTLEKADTVKNLSEIGFSVRPVYAINSYFDLWAEGGIAKVKRELNNNTDHDTFIAKISAGPQLKLNFGFAETSVRAYVTYYNEEDKKTGEATNNTDDIIGGFQMSVWW